MLKLSSMLCRHFVTSRLSFLDFCFVLGLFCCVFFPPLLNYEVSFLYLRLAHRSLGTIRRGRESRAQTDGGKQGSVLLIPSHLQP